MTDHSAAPSIEVLSPGRYRLDQTKSQVHYSGKHMFGMGTVHAVFTIQEGELRLGEPMASSSATVTVAAASFKSNNAKRDKDVRSAGLLDVDTYPDITFASHSLQPTRDGWLVHGAVTAYGHTVPVDVRIDRLTHEGNGIRVHGQVEHLDRTAFGITGSRGMVGRYFDLELDVFATAR
jgi:polyisoprenoid-binding protein YceI